MMAVGVDVSAVWLIVFAVFFFFQAEDGIRDLVRSRGLGDVYKRQECDGATLGELENSFKFNDAVLRHLTVKMNKAVSLSLIHI